MGRARPRRRCQACFGRTLPKALGWGERQESPRGGGRRPTAASLRWGEMMRLEMAELEEGAKEPTRREAEAAQAVRAEGRPLPLLRCRRDLPLRRAPNPHVVLAG